jgi:hypothetical protein
VLQQPVMVQAPSSSTCCAHFLCVPWQTLLLLLLSAAWGLKALQVLLLGRQSRCCCCCCWADRARHNPWGPEAQLQAQLLLANWLWRPLGH